MVVFSAKKAHFTVFAPLMHNATTARPPDGEPKFARTERCRLSMSWSDASHLLCERAGALRLPVDLGFMECMEWMGR